MNFIEELIRQAIDEGAFDDLPGKGRPLDMQANPHEDPAWRSAYRMLKNSGFSLPWIERRRQIEGTLEAHRTDLARAWRKYRAALGMEEEPPGARDSWEQAVARFRQQVRDLNREIRDYNLQVPAIVFQRAVLDADREISALQGDGS